MSTADLLWVTLWYDGPLAGLCTYKGQTCWFTADGEGDVPDVWGLYQLADDQLAAVMKDKAEFEELVGTRWSYDVPRSMRAARPQETHAQYYEDRRLVPSTTLADPARHVASVTELRDPRKDS